MRIAFLIQCHQNAEQINILTDLLSSLGDDVYIHLDKKSTAERNKIQVNNNVTILSFEESFSVEWGQYSQCDAICALIKAAMASGREYDYMWLISGQDFPIKSISTIKEYLSSEVPTPYINIISRENVEKLGFDKRNDVAHPACLIGKKTYQRILRKLWHGITGGKFATFGIFKKKRPVDSLYYGSTWWCLPVDCVKQMMEFLNATDGYVQYFLTSVCPDESFFQTLFMNTEYAGKQADNLTYIDWSAKECSPKYFSKDDYEFLITLSERYLFVRKVDFDRDPELMNLLLKRATGNM